MSTSSKRIFVAGHRGLVGSAIVRSLQRQGEHTVLVCTRAQVDLTDAIAVNEYLAQQRPDEIYIAAARVGGIFANNTYPAEFIQQNLAIQSNLIEGAFKVGIQRLLFLGSSCIYPRDAPQPIREEYLLTGPLEPTNRPYAIAKIAGIEMCWSYNRQYGTQYLCAMPTNLYGPGDNYNLDTGHVLPALIRKCHDAKHSQHARIVAWGSGRPRREFLYSEDMADACVHLMEHPSMTSEALAWRDQPPVFNIGCGEDLAIAELAQLVAEVVGYEGEIVWDRSKPDGTPRKLLCVERLRRSGWAPQVGLREGIRLAYADYLQGVGS